MAQFILSAFADETSDQLAHQIEALKRNGLAYIEPRNVEGSIQKKSEAEVAEISRTLQEAGIGISAYGSPIGKFSIEEDFDEQLAQLRHAIRICKLLGTRRMRMFSFFVEQDKLTEHRDEVIRRLRVFLDEAKKEGITLCHENEAKIYGQNPAEVKDLLTELPDLRGVFDAANYVREGQDPLAGIEATLPSLEYLHVKDAKAEDRSLMPAGLGDGCYEEVLRRVDAATDRTVFLTVEPHLHIFHAFKRIDSHSSLKTRLHFDNSDDAFDCAVSHLKRMLTSLGFHEEEDHIWKK